MSRVLSRPANCRALRLISTNAQTPGGCASSATRSARRWVGGGGEGGEEEVEGFGEAGELQGAALDLDERADPGVLREQRHQIAEGRDGLVDIALPEPVGLVERDAGQLREGQIADKVFD